MNVIDITISESDKGSVFRLEKLLSNCMCNYEKIETKDGIVYCIEFKNEKIRDIFLNDWSK
jgi:hypothetical protein